MTKTTYKNYTIQKRRNRCYVNNEGSCYCFRNISDAKIAINTMIEAKK